MSNEPKRYRVSIEYLIREKSEVTIIADNTDQAERFALSGWRAQHKEVCIEPEVILVTEL